MRGFSGSRHLNFLPNVSAAAGSMRGGRSTRMRPGKNKQWHECVLRHTIGYLLGCGRPSVPRAGQGIGIRACGQAIIVVPEAGSLRRPFLPVVI